ncbi:MAG: hypothetical protein JXO72_02545 [Vicinamibacteria bacterium]|nr:hypothetical protein [Vicinamibacteria bacterium]
MRYEWDFDGDGKTDWTSSLSGKAMHAYGALGLYTTKVTIKRILDHLGLSEPEDDLMSAKTA